MVLVPVRFRYRGKIKLMNMENKIDYEKEVRKVYPVKSDIDCEFYFDKKAQEKLWHVDVIDYKKVKMVCIGKGLFRIDAWHSAYQNLLTQGKIKNV